MILMHTGYSVKTNRLYGVIYNHPNLPNGERMQTSEVVCISPCNTEAETVDANYKIVGGIIRCL